MKTEWLRWEKLPEVVATIGMDGYPIEGRMWIYRDDQGEVVAHAVVEEKPIAQT